MQQHLSAFFTEEIAQRAALVERHGAADPLISGLSYDSRRISAGSLYFALPGLHTNGHTFIDAAIAKGAVAIVHQEGLERYDPNVVYLRVTDSRFALSPIASAFFGAPSRDLAVIGVTGTEGKSTTVYLIYQLLELAGKKAGFVSTVQYRIGEKEEWNPEHQTTPEATTVQSHLAAMRDSGLEYAVIESSSHGLSPRTNRLGDVAFDVAVMTNVTHEHLEFHGTWEQYRDDKANLFRALERFPHDKTRIQGRVPAFAVANADDPSVDYFATICDRRTYTFSTKGAEADLSAQSIQSDASGNSYEVKVRASTETIRITDNLPGAFNVGNVLAALLVVSGLLDRPVAELAPLAAQLRPVRGRMSVIDLGQPFELLIDYAHTPSSFEAVLPPLSKRIAASGGRLITLFGSAGERDTAKRPQQARIAADNSDIVILADEDPRGEDPMALLEEMAAGCPERLRGENLFLIPGRAEAIAKAIELAKPGDAVILLGKGHENSIIYASGTIRWDEFAEAEKALRNKGYGV